MLVGSTVPRKMSTRTRAGQAGNRTRLSSLPVNIDRLGLNSALTDEDQFNNREYSIEVIYSGSG